MNSKNNKIKGWGDLISKHNEKEIRYKKVIDYFDFFDYIPDFANVYEPAEDSFLMIDSILAEKNFLVEKLIKNSIEIGCGSGLVSLCFLDIFSESKANVYPNHVCLDINQDCLNLAERLFDNFNYNAEFVNSNLFDKYNNKEDFPLGKKFDFIFFNPPYVTTDKEELEKARVDKDIAASWAGGIRGSEVIFDFIEAFGEHIYENTVIFLLLSDENLYGEIIEKVVSKYGFKFECLMKRQARNENLTIIKFFY